MKRSSEYNTFDRTMRKLMSVPHGEVKAKLDAEKKTNKKTRKPRKREQ